jgi:Restriction endonuclease AspBHI N-terminal/Restriction endonuclease
MKILDSLRIDALYRNTNNWNSEEDQFNKFFRFSDGKGINNTSGFRPKSRSDIKSTEIINCAFCVLVTNLGEHEWPDQLDSESGLFTYYGDNRKPGTALDDTQVGGNKFLQKIFSNLHLQQRRHVQPILCFEVVKSDNKTFMKFLGLAVPGAQGLSAVDDLVAVWKLSEDQRFQNYRSIFTILQEEIISKNWLEDLVSGLSPIDSKFCPSSWKHWVNTGIYKALEAEKQITPRSKSSQLPITTEEKQVLDYLWENLSDREFEYASAELVKLLDKSFKNLFITRATRDGGKDVVGEYYLGHIDHQIRLSAYIEAKKWKLDSAIGVKPMMRLISRLKHRDIGVFVTTSYFDKQVQSELIEDGHPVILVSGGDIARLLIQSDISTGPSLTAWVSAIKSKSDQI